MKIKWYWLAKQLGLMEDLSTGAETLYRVSAKADDFFETALLALIPALFFLGFLMTLLLYRRQREKAAIKLTRCFTAILLLYGLLLATGIGPYIQFYPRGGGFIDLSPITNVLAGLYCGLLAFLLFIGSKLARWLSRRAGGK